MVRTKIRPYPSLININPAAKADVIDRNAKTKRWQGIPRWLYPPTFCAVLYLCDSKKISEVWRPWRHVEVTCYNRLGLS